VGILWEPYNTPRSDCIVLVKRWGDGVRWGWSAWRAIHQPTQITAYVSFDRPVPDNDALAQLFQELDGYVERAADDAARGVAVRQPTKPRE
jgi:hypothetical protein